MIYTNKRGVDEKTAFEDLLSETATLVLGSIELKKITSGNQFEKFVFEKIQIVSKGTIFENTLYQKKDREFPDIVAKGYWGIEVKFTKEDKWESIGNSILESSRIDSVEKIYIFFGKCGGIPNIKYRLYEECLSGIAVTHYPRYKIDMNLALGESIFEKMNISYEQLRKENYPVKAIRKFYKSQLKENDSLWWIDDEDSSSKSFQIQFFSNLEKKQKTHLVIEGFILYPEVLASKYAGLCAFWVSYYSVICPNMRDQYSASGQIDGLSKIYYKFLKQYSHEIYQLLQNIELALVADCWNMELPTRELMIKEWKRKIDSYTPIDFTYQLSELFEKQLNYE